MDKSKSLSEAIFMNAKTSINVRTTGEIKSNANEVLKALGLDISTAVNMFLIQVAEQKAIPFEIALTVPTKRKLGGLEGKIWMSDDFCAPMEEFGEYM